MLTWRRKPDVLASFGSFWELFNRIKRTGPTGVVGISCFESEFSLEGFVGPGVPTSVVKTPGCRCCGAARETVMRELESMLAAGRLTDIVIMCHHDCSYLAGRSPESHCLFELRQLTTHQLIAEGLRRRRIKLHAWMEGPNRQLRVFLPRAEKFVSPIAAI